MHGPADVLLSLFLFSLRFSLLSLRFSLLSLSSKSPSPTHSSFYPRILTGLQTTKSENLVHSTWRYVSSAIIVFLVMFEALKEGIETCSDLVPFVFQ